MSRPPLRMYRRLSRSDIDSQAGRSLPLAGRDPIHWTHCMIEPILTLLRARPADASMTSHPHPTRSSASTRRSQLARTLACRSRPTPRIHSQVRARRQRWLPYERGRSRRKRPRRTARASRCRPLSPTRAARTGSSPTVATSTSRRPGVPDEVEDAWPMGRQRPTRMQRAARRGVVGGLSVSTLARTAHGRCPVRAPECRRVQRPLQAVLEGGWHIMYSSRTNAMMFSNK
jgi:hypothetical protein